MMMNSHFNQIKQHVSIIDACNAYGIKLDRNGKAQCPFHAEKEGSFSAKGQIFNCFGCGKKGDVITLTQLLFSLKPYEALAKLNSDFHCGLNLDYRPSRKEIIKTRQDKELKEQFEKWVRRTEDILYSYFRELHFASFESESFKKAEIQVEKDKIDYYIEWLAEDPISFYKLNKGAVEKIERRRIEGSGLYAV